MNGKTVVFFDVDGTLLKGNVNTSIMLEAYRKGMISFPLLVRGGFWYVLWRLGWYGDLQTIGYRGARRLKGVSVEDLQKLSDDAFRDLIQPKIYQEARDIIERHRREGHELIILSSSYRPFVERVAWYFSISQVIATELAVENNTYTGRLDGEVVGGRKHSIVQEYLDVHKPDRSFAYTDHIQDAPMLDIVTDPFAVNPDSRLSRYAKRKGWPILRFSGFVQKTSA